MKLALMTFILVCTTIIWAQPPHVPPHHHYLDKRHVRERLEHMKAQKIGFITHKLSLTSEEAQKFWPIYNDFESKMTKNFLKMREIEKEINHKDIETLSDEEIAEHLDKLIQFKEEEVINMKALEANLSKVISKKKILRLLFIEKEFRIHALNRIKSNRQNRK